jgi:hypothetical protein
LIRCKNLCKCHNAPPSSITIKKKKKKRKKKKKNDQAKKIKDIKKKRVVLFCLSLKVVGRQEKVAISLSLLK